jgi:hypothetical protein
MLCTGRTAHRRSRGIRVALPFLDHGTRRGWGVSVTPRPLLPPGKTRYPLYRRLGGPQGRSGQVRKISPPPGFEPRTVQPVASRYTDWATRPTEWSIHNNKPGQAVLHNAKHKIPDGLVCLLLSFFAFCVYICDLKESLLCINWIKEAWREAPPSRKGRSDPAARQ